MSLETEWEQRLSAQVAAYRTDGWTYRCLPVSLSNTTRLNTQRVPPERPWRYLVHLLSSIFFWRRRPIISASTKYPDVLNFARGLPTGSQRMHKSMISKIFKFEEVRTDDNECCR